MRKTFLSLFFILALCTSLFAADIEGFWKTMDKNTGKPRCIVALYPYQGMYYGRIIATFDENGKMADTIYKPQKRAPGVWGNPYYCGLDLLWNLQNNGNRYKGKIIDPEEGKIYRAEVWTQNGNLIVRGELLFFGRSEVWLPMKASEFPKDFKKPDLNSFVPVIPQVSS